MVWYQLFNPAKANFRKNLLSFQKNLFFRKMSTSSEVIFEELGDKAIITLNRPKALNALTLGMIREIYPKLQEWEKSKSLVIIKGGGEKAFCAGGDIISVVNAGKKKESLTRDFFREEYLLNHLIGTYHIPYIAFINGITMGGGVGLSVHGTYRIASEKTLFAMPETGIGLFTDVGGGYVLPRLGGKLGLYLALTGHRLKGRDNVMSGIATHFCDQSQFDGLQEALINMSSHYPEDIRGVIGKFSSESTIEKDKEFSLKSHLPIINKCFNGSSVEEIISNLKKEGSEWSLKQVALFEKMSPTSMKITFELLKRGENLSLPECLQLEFRLTQRCCEDNDFYEGVRALLVDRDNSPKWNPSTLSEVGDDIVERYFSPLPEGYDLVI